MHNEGFKDLAHFASSRILIVDDDQQLVRELQAHLMQSGYDVVTATDGHQALQAVESKAPDLVVLDINFTHSSATDRPSIDGVEVLRRLRESEDDVPVLMLSKTNIASIKVMALNIGADDYLSKPCELRELSARIEAILRRSSHESPNEKVLNYHRLRLDPSERRIWKDGVLTGITGIEFDILYALSRRPGHVFTRDRLIENAWKGNAYCVPKAVDVHIGHIRKEIEDDPKNPAFIITVRGTGYRFEDVPVSDVTA